MIGEHILRGSKHPDEGGLWKVEANQGDREMPDAPNKADYDHCPLTTGSLIACQQSRHNRIVLFSLMRLQLKRT